MDLEGRSEMLVHEVGREKVGGVRVERVEEWERDG